MRVDSDPSSGVRILAGGKNLVIQGIQRRHTGNYTCTAFNLEGEDTSNAVVVTVMCKFILFAGINHALMYLIAEQEVISKQGGILNKKIKQAGLIYRAGWKFTLKKLTLIRPSFFGH